MSQFIMCHSAKDLHPYGFSKMLAFPSNQPVYQAVAETYFPKGQLSQLWIKDDIDSYCTRSQTQLQSGEKPMETDLFKLLYALLNVCSGIALWYGADYEDLDRFTAKGEFFEAVRKGLDFPSCEIYCIYSD